MAQRGDKEEAGRGGAPGNEDRGADGGGGDVVGAGMDAGGGSGGTRRLSRAERRRLRQYERAVRRMAPVERAIFLGHVTEGLSYAELAVRHGIAVCDVEGFLWRALGAIADIPDENPRKRWQFWRR